MIGRIKHYFKTLGLPGLVCAIRAKVGNSTDLFELKRDDLKYPFFLRVRSSDILVYEKVFQDEEYEFIAESSPRVIVDAGAHIGLASIYFANKYPEAKIIAIEPEERNFALLKRNVAPYEMVVPIQAALWSHNKEVNIVDPGGGNWGFMTEEQNTSKPTSRCLRHWVTATTVENLFTNYGLDRIDILKIDIEGAEKEVFRDTSAWIGKVDALIIELHEHLNPGCARSFYNGSNGFDNEWLQGENVFLSRAWGIIKCARSKRG